MKNSYGDLSGFGSDIQGKIVERDAVLEEKKISVGVLGRLFGCSDNSSKNIAGLVVVFSFIIPSLISCLATPDEGRSRFECWNIFTPLSLVLLDTCSASLRGEWPGDSHEFIK